LAEYIANELKTIMAERGLSLKKLAELSGVGPAQMSRVIHAQNYTVATLEKVLIFLGYKIKIEKW
jgi:transcriptional regulator with XRE-family HTH domain